MDTLKQWQQAAELVIETEYSQLTEARKARLKQEFCDFVYTCDFNMPLDYDDVYNEFVGHFYNHQNNIMSSCGNEYKTDKEYFYKQLETVMVLSLEMVNPTENPVALISTDVANILFNKNYLNGKLVMV